MTDNPTPNDVPTTPTESTPAEAKNTEQHMIPKSRFDEVNEARKQLQAQIDELTAQQAAQREQELAEQNRYKELFEDAQQRLAQLDSLNEQATRYQEALQATNKARLERIPEARRTLVPDYDDPVKLGAWLDANEALLIDPGKPTPPPADGSAGSSGSTDAPGLPAGVQTLTDIARQHGYTVNSERIAKIARQKNQSSSSQE
jgi:multidrug efflux pump subunit AcrA (membrane-fusion protein)